MSLSEKIANAESSDWLCKGMADEEVIKVISEAKEEARKRIKLVDTLDKIRAEIENHCGFAKEYHCEYCHQCYNLMRVREILETIDKYKAESEE